MSAPAYNLRNKPGRSKMSELSSLNDSTSSVFQKVTSLLIPGNKSKTAKAILAGSVVIFLRAAK